MQDYSVPEPKLAQLSSHKCAAGIILLTQFWPNMFLICTLVLWSIMQLSSSSVVLTHFWLTALCDLNWHLFEKVKKERKKRQEGAGERRIAWHFVHLRDLAKVISEVDRSSVEARARRLRGWLAFDDRVGGGACPLQSVGCRFKLCYCA